MVINKQNYVCQDLDFMQKWVVNGLFGAPTEPIKNRSAVAVWPIPNRTQCGLGVGAKVWPQLRFMAKSRHPKDCA